MNLLRIDLRKAAIVILVIALPLLSLNMKRSPDDDPWYLQPMATVSAYMQTAFSGFAQGIRGTTAMYINLIGVKKENAELKNSNQNLGAQLGRLEEISTENDRLRSLLEFKQSTKMKILAAEVVARDLSPDHYSIRINRGAKQGVKKFQGVITPGGVVGYVVHVETNSSKVLVVNDRSSALDAVVQRTRARGLVSGRGLNAGRLRYLQRSDDTSKGDLIVTSGFRGYFPKGFPIGKVTDISQTMHGISPEAQIETVINIGKIEEVFVVLDPGHEDFNERFGGGEFGPPLLSKMNPETDPQPASVDGAKR